MVLRISSRLKHREAQAEGSRSSQGSRSPKPGLRPYLCPCCFGPMQTEALVPSSRSSRLLTAWTTIVRLSLLELPRYTRHTHHNYPPSNLEPDQTQRAAEAVNRTRDSCRLLFIPVLKQALPRSAPSIPRDHSLFSPWRPEEG